MTELQRAAKRPGGLRRAEALRAASDNINLIKPRFGPWLQNEIDNLKLLVATASASKRAARAPLVMALRSHSGRIADVAATMDYALVSFVAKNLQKICDALDDGAEWDDEVIGCHIDALHLGSQRKYFGMTPQDLPELRDGLERIIKSKNARRSRR